MDMLLNWKKGPGFKRIENITIPEYEELSLDNGTKLITVNQGSQEIFRLDLVYRGARFLEHKKLASKLTSSLIREGTASKSSADIAELIDFYGAHMKTGANLDFNYLSLSGLIKHLEVLMPIIEEIIYQPIFNESEIEKYKKNNIQKLALDLSKNEMVNYRVFTEALYGKHHPYGYNTEKEYIEAITRNDLVRHHQEAFGCNNSFIMIGGKLDGKCDMLINKYFGQSHHKAIDTLPFTIESVSCPQRIKVSSKNEHQASIKIGRRMFNRNHPDFASMFVLNTILGGYFGSRLMASIREDLAYTYDIHSMLDQLVYDGYFFIETEVTPENIELTINEIYKQINILQTEAVEENELQMVKNYLIGNFLNLVDGPLNTLSFIRSLEIDHSSRADFDIFIQKIKTITAEELMAIANKYLNKEDMIEVVVGG